MLAQQLFGVEVLVADTQLYRVHATIYADGSIPETEAVDVMTDAGREKARDAAKDMLLCMYPRASVIAMGDIDDITS